MENRRLERVRYWQGQLLRSADFNRIHTVEAQRRWWHNRAAHNAYGIYQDPEPPNGLNVTLSQDELSAEITAGLAYDRFGRELIVETDQVIALPPITEKDQQFTLVMQYRVKTSGDRYARPGAFCAQTGMIPNFVELVWKEKQSVCWGYVEAGVPLADLEIQKGTRSLKVTNPPTSRPLSRPLLASGTTVAGNTPWELWTEGADPNQRITFGVQTTIDTSAAGFTDSPCYFAWLQGPLFQPQTGRILLSRFQSITAETVNSFVFRLYLPTPRAEFFGTTFHPQPTQRFITTDDFQLFAHKQGLYVSWVGCQKNVAAPVSTTLLRNPGLLIQLLSSRTSVRSDLSAFTSILGHINKL